MRLEEMLRDLPAPPADEARERAVAEARAEVAEREASPLRSTRRPARRTLATALAAVLLALVLLTPPGRDASAWVGQLVGIGDVGGSPTLKETGPFAEPGTGVVIANGHGPDGARYEWVVYDCEADLSAEGLPSFKGFGMSLEWPGVKGMERSGTCEEAGGGREERDAEKTEGFEQVGVNIAPSQFDGVAEPDLLVSGATTPGVHRVEVVYRDTRGDLHELPVDFSGVPKDLRDRLGERAPAGAFVAFVPGAWAARDEVAERLNLRALADTGNLELSEFARAERRQMRSAFVSCAHLIEKRGEHGRCVEQRRPPSPIEVIAYDEQGAVLQRYREPLGVVIPEHALYPDGPMPWKERPSNGSGEPVVLTAGRAPGGARYEFFVQPSGGPGICAMLWWPRYEQAGSSGHCGPSLPPEAAFGRRSPEDVMAKPFGFLNDARPATDHWLVSGFARPQVARVEVMWGSGGDRAGAELVRVRGELGERMDVSEPFGFWVAFVPRDARHADFEIVSYGDDGREIGRHSWRSDVTN